MTARCAKRGSREGTGRSCSSVPSLTVLDGSLCGLTRRGKCSLSRWRDEGSSCHSTFVAQEVEGGTGVRRVLYLHRNSPLPHGLQDLRVQPLSLVSGAHHNNLYPRFQHPENREALFSDILMRSHVPLDHGLWEQRTRSKHAVSVDSETSAIVAVDVYGLRELVLQQRDARPLV